MDVSRWAIDLKLAPANRGRREDLVRNGNILQNLVPHARIALRSYAIEGPSPSQF